MFEIYEEKFRDLIEEEGKEVHLIDLKDDIEKGTISIAISKTGKWMTGSTWTSKDDISKNPTLERVT